MSYKQLIKPDLKTVGNVGWCLKFVEDAYNTPHIGATATAAWKATRYPHENRSLPTDVDVPLWFSYVENGLNFGHVVISVPGRGYLSSPYKQDGTQQWLSSIGQVEQIYNCKYLGWSEDLAGIILVKKEDDDMLTSKGQMRRLWLQFLGREPTTKEYSDYIGKRSYSYTVDKLSAARKDLPAALTKIKELEANPAQKVLDQIKKLLNV